MALVPVYPTINPPSGVMWWSPRETRSALPAVSHEDSEGRSAFVALVVFTFVLLLSPQTWISGLASLRIALIAAGAAAVLLIADRWKRRKRLLNVSPEVLVAMALQGWAILTLPLSYWPGGSLAVLTDPYLKAFAVFWLLMNIVTTERRLRVIVITLVLCTIPLVSTAVKNSLTGTYVEGGEASGRILGYHTALALNPNDMALMLNLILPFGIALFLSTTRPMVRLLCLFVIAFDVLGVILTLSRGGFIGLATIGAVYFIKLVRRPAPDRGWAFGILVIAILSLPFLPASYVQRIGTITDIDSDPTGSSQARWRDNVAATSFVMEHPILGAGIGMDVLALNQVRGPVWKQVHNVYLEYAVDLGLPGLILFLLLFFSVFRAARSTRHRLSSVPALRNLFLLAEALEVSLIVFAVEGLFHPVAYHFYFYYMAGLALAARVATNNAIALEPQ